MPKIESRMKTAVKSGPAPDRGDARCGVLLKIQNYQVWLTQAEALQLENQLVNERMSR